MLNKIRRFSSKVSDIFTNVGRGIVTGMDDCFILTGEMQGDKFVGFSKALKEKVELEKDLLKPILMGNRVHAFSTLFTTTYVIYPHVLVNGKTIAIEEMDLELQYPLTYSYLSKFRDTLIAKKIK